MTGNRGESRYKMIRMLGKGSFGEIRVARDHILNRDVALKVLHERFMDNGSVVNRFVNEAETLAILEHPNIIPIHDAGRLDDGRPYFSMRLVEGGNLEQLATHFHEENRRVPPVARYRLESFKQLLTQLRDAGRAIAHAHQKGVVHRDLKPSNILICNSGQTFVVDWGTAKTMVVHRDQRAVEFGKTMIAGEMPNPANEVSHETVHGMILGTPAFMSPEQAQGRTEDITYQTDVYGLGAALYFLITGRPPHFGDILSDVLTQAQKGEYTPIPQVVEDVPEQLVHICDRALHSNPQERFETVDEVLVEIDRFLTRADAPPAVPSMLSKPGAQNGSIWPWVSMTLLGILFCAGGAGIYQHQSMMKQHKEEMAHAAKKDTTEDSDSTSVVTPVSNDDQSEQIESLQSQLQDAQEENSQLQENIDQQRRDLEQADADMATLQAEIRDSEGRIVSAREQLQAAESELESLRERIASDGDLDSDSLIQSQRQEIETLQQSLATAMQQASEQEIALQEIETQRDDLQSRLTAAQEQSTDNQTRLEELADELRDTRNMFEVAEEALQEASDEIGSRDRQLNRLQTELASTIDDFESARQDLAEMQTQNRELQSRIDALGTATNNGQNNGSPVSSGFDTDELAAMLNDAKIDANALGNIVVEVTLDDRVFRLSLHEGGDLMLYYAIEPGEWTLEMVNGFNLNHRLARVYLTTGDIAAVSLESDLTANDGLSQREVIEFVKEFRHLIELLETFPATFDDLDTLNVPPPAPIPDDGP